MIGGGFGIARRDGRGTTCFLTGFFLALKKVPRLIDYMRKLATAFLLLSTFLFAGCLESSKDESSSGENAEESAAGSGGGSQSNGEGEMSFPEALKLKRSLARELEALQNGAQSQEELAARAEEAKAELAEVQQYEQELRALEEALQASLDHWRKATRLSFAGVQLPNISTLGGETYSNVRIEYVGETDLKITHAGGSETLLIEELPLALRKNVIHEPTVLAEIPAP